MSRNRPSPLRAMRARLPRVLESALTAFLYAAGLLLPLCSALALPVGTADMLLACAGFSLLLALFALSPLTALLGAAGALLSLLPYALRLPAQLPGLTQALVLAAQGAPLALRLYAGTLYPLLALLFVLLAFVLSHASGGFYPALALAAFVLLAAWFYGARGDVLLCLPALAALVLLYAHAGEHGATILRALPTALTAALLAALLMPAAAPVSSAMSDFAERVRSVVYDYFFFTEPRTVFSLLLSGYQFWGEAAHEWIGAGMTVLFVAHHLLNLSWHRNLTKGKYTPYRVVMLIVDLSVLLSMAAQAYSGVVMSRHLFADLPIEKGMALARRLHILGAYWGYLLMSLHLGLHWKLLLDALRKRFSRGAPTKGRRRAASKNYILFFHKKIKIVLTEGRIDGTINRRTIYRASHR